MSQRGRMRPRLYVRPSVASSGFNDPAGSGRDHGLTQRLSMSCVPLAPTARGGLRGASLDIHNRSRSEFLAGGPEQDLVYVYVFGLANGVGYRSGEGIGGNGELAVHLLKICGDIRLGRAVEQLRGDHARRD